VRQEFDIGQYLQGLLPYGVHPTGRVDRRIGRICFKLFGRNRQQSQALTNVFVKVARDPVTLLFFCFNHTVAHAGKRILRLHAHPVHQASDDPRSEQESSDGHNIERIVNPKREGGRS